MMPSLVRLLALRPVLALPPRQTRPHLTPSANAPIFTNEVGWRPILASTGRAVPPIGGHEAALARRAQLARGTPERGPRAWRSTVRDGLPERDSITT